MSFALSLALDVVEAEAGATTPVGLTVVNRGAATDRYEVEIEGIDPEWRFVPVPTFPVEPGEGRSEKLFLKPPRLPESVAGSYPFVVRVRSLESGETRTAQALLKLLPFNHLTMEIAPKKGVISPTKKRNDFRLSLVNLGNSEHTLQLSAQDPEERCAYEFDQDGVVLGPGQGREVEMVADPKQTPLFSSGRLIGFSVFARSQNDRGVTATAQAQLEQRSLLSPATLALLALVVALGGGWYAMRPKPVTIDLSVNPGHALPGASITLSYAARNADHVTVRMGEDPPLYDGPLTAQTLTVPLTGQGEAIFTAVATHDGQSSEPSIEHVRIDVPPVVPEAVIAKFYATPTRVRVGTPFTAHWKVENATKIEIEPLPDAISIDREQLDVTPSTEGEHLYRLVATNAAGHTVRKTLKVEVYDESDAQIIAFAADPATAKETEGGKTTLSWQITGSVRQELTVGTNPAITVDATGSKDVVVVGKTPCVLTAYDDKGRKRIAKVAVAYEKAPLAPTEPTTAGTATAGTTGAPPTDPNYPDRLPPPASTTGP